MSVACVCVCVMTILTRTKIQLKRNIIKNNLKRVFCFYKRFENIRSFHVDSSCFSTVFVVIFIFCFVFPCYICWCLFLFFFLVVALIVFKLEIKNSICCILFIICYWFVYVFHTVAAATFLVFRIKQNVFQVAFNALHLPPAVLHIYRASLCSRRFDQL